MRYVWNKDKAAATLKDRIIDIADVVGVFADEYGLYKEDTSPSFGEERFVVFGMDFLGCILRTCLKVI